MMEAIEVTVVKSQVDVSFTKISRGDDSGWRSLLKPVSAQHRITFRREWGKNILRGISIECDPAGNPYKNSKGELLLVDGKSTVDALCDDADEFKDVNWDEEDFSKKWQ